NKSAYFSLDDRRHAPMNRTRIARLAKGDRANFARRVAARDYPRLLKHVLQRLFPDSSSRVKAMRLLQRYGSGTAEPERDRVHLAILKLVGADLARIATAVDGAKEDHEDTLSWAEARQQTQLRIGNRKLAPREATQVAAQDR